MKVLSIHLTNDENSRMKAVAEVLLDNGMIIQDVRVIESEGILAVYLMQQNDIEDAEIDSEQIDEIEKLVIKSYRELLDK